MPSINQTILVAGPLLDVQVWCTAQRVHALERAGLVLPPPVMGKFLVDTGASTTCVDVDLLDKLSLQPTGKVPVQTPSTGGKGVDMAAYDVGLRTDISAIGTEGFHVAALPVLASHLKDQGFDGLLGRDVLDRCVLIYNGHTRQFTLSY